MDYEVLYLISYFNIPLITYISLVGALVAIAVIIVLFIKKKQDIFKMKMVKNIIIFVVMDLLFNSTCIFSYFENINSLKVGNYKLLEGKVERFTPSSSNSKGIEYLKVNGITFKYSNALINGGLNQSIAYSGIQQGSDVRIYYKGKAILKVEMKK